MSSLRKDLLILVLIGLIGAAIFVFNYKMLGKTRWAA